MFFFKKTSNNLLFFLRLIRLAAPCKSDCRFIPRIRCSIADIDAYCVRRAFNVRFGYFWFDWEANFKSGPKCSLNMNLNSVPAAQSRTQTKSYCDHTFKPESKRKGEPGDPPQTFPKTIARTNSAASRDAAFLSAMNACEPLVLNGPGAKHRFFFLQLDHCKKYDALCRDRLRTKGWSSCTRGF